VNEVDGLGGEVGGDGGTLIVTCEGEGEKRDEEHEDGVENLGLHRDGGGQYIKCCEAVDRGAQSVRIDTVDEKVFLKLNLLFLAIA